MSLEAELKEKEVLDKIEEKLRKGEKIPVDLQKHVVIQPGKPGPFFHEELKKVLQRYPSRKEPCPVCESTGFLDMIAIEDEHALRVAFRDALASVLMMKPKGITLSMVDKMLYVTPEMKAGAVVNPEDFTVPLGEWVDFMVSTVEVDKETLQAPTEKQEAVNEGTESGAPGEMP